MKRYVWSVSAFCILTLSLHWFGGIDLSQAKALYVVFFAAIFIALEILLQWLSDKKIEHRVAMVTYVVAFPVAMLTGPDTMANLLLAALLHMIVTPLIRKLFAKNHAS